MNFSKKQLRIRYSVATTGTLVLFFSAIVGTALAQTFYEPNGVGSGGRSATYLDTSSTTQRKLGSLIVGDNTGDKFCLNASSSNPPAAEKSCISAWSGLTTFVGGPFVRTNTTKTPSSPTNPTSYDPFYQTGYARIKGNAATASDSVVATANYTVSVSSAAAVYGNDYGDFSNYAGYFSGKLIIDNHFKLNPGDPDIPGQLCLNSTAPYNPTGPLPRYGCISQWTDISGTTVSPYIKLQAANPPITQVGSAQISKSWQLGAAVAGEAFTGYGTAFCGDGLCSTNIGESSGSCSADCSSFSGFGNITTDLCLDQGQCDSGMLIAPSQE